MLREASGGCGQALQALQARTAAVSVLHTCIMQLRLLWPGAPFFLPPSLHPLNVLKTRRTKRTKHVRLQASAEAFNLQAELDLVVRALQKELASCAAELQRSSLDAEAGREAARQLEEVLRWLCRASCCLSEGSLLWPLPVVCCRGLRRPCVCTTTGVPHPPMSRLTALFDQSVCKLVCRRVPRTRP